MPEAYLVDAVRTPMGAYRGALSGVRPDDLAAHAIGAVVERSGVDPEQITDVYFGAANQSGEDNRDVARMAALLAGLPQSVPGATVNRLCASGLEAVNAAARAVKLGEGDFYLAGGVESMSRAPWVVEKPERGLPRGDADDARHDPRLAHGQPADGRARRLDRVDGRDRRERRRALRGQPRGPGRLRAAQPPARGRRRRGGPACRGDRPDRGAARAARPSSSRPTRGRAPTPRWRSWPKLRPVFREGGTVTAGNASTLNDGAACLLVASEAGAERARRRAAGPGRRLRRRRRRPRLHGDRPGRGGPARARRRRPRRSTQIDLIELNEAFASQVLACVGELGIDEERLNVNGGAIALGHPLGCSGARLTTTLVRELRRRGGRYGVATLCVGVGQGLATVVENPAAERSGRRTTRVASRAR